MPLFTLTTPPPENCFEEFMEESATEAQDKTEDASSPTAIKINDQNCGNFDCIKLVKMDEDPNTRETLDLKSTEKVQVDLTTNKQALEIQIIEWLDYSSKYGIGYLLSNGSIGAFFNDCSKIILDPAGKKFKYIEAVQSEESHEVSCHLINDYPESLKKKVLLLLHFQSRFAKSLFLIETNSKKADETNIFAYVKQWKSTKHATMFKLNNNDLQIHFKDNTRLMFRYESKMMIFIDNREIKTEYHVSEVGSTKDVELIKRIQYTLKKLDSKTKEQNTFCKLKSLVFWQQYRRVCQTLRNLIPQIYNFNGQIFYSNQIIKQNYCQFKNKQNEIFNLITFSQQNMHKYELQINQIINSAQFWYYFLQKKKLTFFLMISIQISPAHADCSTFDCLSKISIPSTHGLQCNEQQIFLLFLLWIFKGHPLNVLLGMLIVECLVDQIIQCIALQIAQLKLSNGISLFVLKTFQFIYLLFFFILNAFIRKVYTKWYIFIQI